MSIFPWNISTLHVSFFHVLYDKAITFDFDLKSVRSTALEHLGAAANRPSRLDGERELVGRSRPTQTKYEYCMSIIITRGLMYNQARI